MQFTQHFELITCNEWTDRFEEYPSWASQDLELRNN